jgi:hypothetical protein
VAKHTNIRRTSIMPLHLAVAGLRQLALQHGQHLSVAGLLSAGMKV